MRNLDTCRLLGLALSLFFMASVFVAPVKSAEALLPQDIVTVKYQTLQHYPVSVGITEDYKSVRWAFDAVGSRTLQGNGHWGIALIISYDGITPEYQIHNNDGTCSAYPWGTWLYSPYDKDSKCWHTSNASWNTPVSDVDGISASGNRDKAANPGGVFTITIEKNEKDIYYAIWVGVGGFYNPNNGYSVYPSAFLWGAESFAWAYDYEYVEAKPTEQQVQTRSDSSAVLDILSVDDMATGVSTTDGNRHLDYNGDGTVNIADPFDQMCSSGLTWMPAFRFSPEAAQAFLRTLQGIYGPNLENMSPIDGRVWVLYVLTYLPYT